MLDSQNNPVDLEGYSNAQWSADDNQSIVLLDPRTLPDGKVALKWTGVPGTFNLTARHTRANSPDITLTTQVVVTGPVPDHIVINITAV